MPIDDPNVDQQLEAPMLWIGMYAAAASTICTLAMAADVLHGLRSRKYWFPSRYFSLNAAYLTLLAVAMKLPVDLSTKMYSVTDRLAKVSSLAFMSIAMANFSTSLGSMGDKSVMMNVVALGILVVTVSGNVCIQIIQMRSYLESRRVFWEESLAMGLMLVLLVMFVSSALTILSTKQYLETRYRDMHNSALNEERMVDMRRLSAKKLRVLIKKYWVMAETSSLQFVIARSAMSTVPGIVSLLIAVVLVEAEIRSALKEGIFGSTFSNYKQSTRAILLSQTVGVIVGAIAPISRWFVAVNHRASTDCRSNIRTAFTVEGYWTWKLVEWRKSSLPVEIRYLRSRKLLHGLKGVILQLCIFSQHLIVLINKLALAVCFSMRQICSSSSTCSRDSIRDQEMDIGLYVIQLEGEMDMPAETLSNIFEEVDEIIEKSKTRKPKNLLNLLSKSFNFKGVMEFDSDQVPNLHNQELPYCWSLPLVTLACIAMAIPNVEKEKSEVLLRSVTEGLQYVKLIDKLLDRKGHLAKVRAAANAVSVEAELNRKWQDKDLDEISVKAKNAEDILKQLHQDSESKVVKFKTTPLLYWPPEIIEANSMYRMSGAILLSRGGGKREKTDEELLEQLSIMIADIMAACLTSLPRAITMKCHHHAIEERERSVRKAANLLGETEEIIGLLQKRELPILAPDKAANIEEWRAVIGLEKENEELVSRPQSTPDHVTINIDTDY